MNCNAITLKGTECRNNAKEGDYCWVHIPKATEPTDSTAPAVDTNSTNTNTTNNALSTIMQSVNNTEGNKESNMEPNPIEALAEKVGALKTNGEPKATIKIPNNKEENMSKDIIVLEFPNGTGRKIEVEEGKEENEVDKMVMIMTTNHLTASMRRAIEIWNDNFRTPNKARMLQTREGLPVIRVNKGSADWRFHFLDRIIERGGSFVIRVMQEPNMMYLRNWFNKASFTYPDIDGILKATSISVYDADGQEVSWDDFEDYVGIKLQASNKIEKRVKEITRLSLFGERREDYIPNIALFQVDPSQEVAYDGETIITQSAAIKMIPEWVGDRKRKDLIRQIKSQRITRGSYRALYVDGLVKGHARVVPDAQFKALYGDADMAMATVDGVTPINTKGEIRTDGWFLQTFQEVHQSYAPMTNAQALASISDGLNWFFDKETLKKDLDNSIEDYKIKLTDPNSALYAPVGEEYNIWGDKDEVVTHVPEDQLSKVTSDMLSHWKASGMHTWESQRLLSMVARQKLNQLDAAFNPKPRFSGHKPAPKVRYPIRWAASMYITTVGMTLAAGYNLRDYNVEKGFYHKPSGAFVLPDNEFIELYDRHGGWDLDDMVTIALALHTDSTIKGVMWRMPTAWGEWSVIDLSVDDFPAYHTWGSIPALDLDNRPEFLEEMDVTYIGLPEVETEMPDTVTQEWVWDRIEVNDMNPGVGQYVNIILAYYDVFGIYPQVALAPMEEIVDTCMQTPTREAFEAIMAFIHQLREEIEQNGFSIDHHVFQARLKYIKSKDAQLTKDSINVDGPFAELVNYGREKTRAYELWIDEVTKELWKPIRALMGNKVPESAEMVLGTRVHNMSPYTWAEKVNDHFEDRVRQYYRDADEETRRYMMGELNRDMVNLMRRQPNLEVAVTALYQVALLSFRGSVARRKTDTLSTRGVADRVFFQTAWDRHEEESMMDVLLDVLTSMGVARRILPKDDSGS